MSKLLEQTFTITSHHGSRDLMVSVLADVIVHVDLEELANALGRRALLSSKSIATALRGAIVVKATNIRPFK